MRRRNFSAVLLFNGLVVKLVIHFVKGFDFFGVEVNSLEKPRAFVGACGFLENVLNHFRLFMLAHTLSMRKVRLFIRPLLCLCARTR